MATIKTIKAKLEKKAKAKRGPTVARKVYSLKGYRDSRVVAQAAIDASVPLEAARSFIAQRAKDDLRALISEKELSIADFEAAIGYTGGMVYLLLKGDRPITYELVGRLFARWGADEAQRIANFLILAGDTKL